MGYGNFKSDKTGYKVGENRYFLQLELRGYGISNIGLD